jgi:hypothetical protein
MNEAHLDEATSFRRHVVHAFGLGGCRLGSAPQASTAGQRPVQPEHSGRALGRLRRRSPVQLPKGDSPNRKGDEEEHGSDNV